MKNSKRRNLLILERIIKAGAINFIRNAWLSVAAIAVMVITLSIVLFSVITNQTFRHTTKLITDKIDVSVYLKDSITDKQREKLIADVKALPNIKSVAYLSKENALAKYKRDTQSNIQLQQAISQTDNPLPASLQIKPKDVNRLDELKNFLERDDIKSLQSDAPSYSGERRIAINKITRATSFFQKAGLVGVIVFAIISMLIIFNTIRMAIFNRRDELNIMRLLGASTFYIRGPFMVETVIYGVVAGLASVLLCSAMFSISANVLEASSLLDFYFANTFFTNNYWVILTVQLFMGVSIGAASSYFATRRYLKFKTQK